MDDFKRHVASHKNVLGVVIDTNTENVIILPQNDHRFVAQQKEKIKSVL